MIVESGSRGIGESGILGRFAIDSVRYCVGVWGVGGFMNGECRVTNDE